MSEPTIVYDKNGNEETVYGSAQLAVELESGKTLEKPKPKRRAASKK